MEEKIMEMVISKEVKAKLMKDFHQWRRIELVTVIFSIIGLILVICDYEVDLFYDGFAGIVNIHDSHKNSKALIQKAIWDREHRPNTHIFKVINVIQAVLCITLLCIRQRLKQKWTNT